MNIDLNSILASPLFQTILGGMIAGVAGISAQWYNHRLQRIRRRRSWLRRLNVLLNQYQHDLGSPTSADAVRDLKTQIDFRKRTSLFLDDLAEHLSQAPTETPEEVWDLYTDIRINVEALHEADTKTGEFIAHMNKINQYSEEIERWARDEVLVEKTFRELARDRFVQVEKLPESVNLCSDTKHGEDGDENSPDNAEAR